MVDWDLFKLEVVKLASAFDKEITEETMTIWFQDILEYELPRWKFVIAMRNIRQASRYVSGNLIPVVIEEAKALPDVNTPLLQEPIDREFARNEMDKLEKLMKEVDNKCKLT